MKQYKAQEYSSLANLMEWVNDWVVEDEWTFYKFTHQENEEGCFYVAILEQDVVVDEE